VLSGGQRPWYGVTCPPPASTVQLILGDNENLGSSTFPPASLVPTNNDPVWTSSTSANIVLGYLDGFWVDVNDPAIAAAAQRDLLYSGVLYGVVGGLLAAWLIAGVTVAVTKAIKVAVPAAPPDGPATPPDGDGAAADHAQREAEQVQGGQQPARPEHAGPEHAAEGEPPGQPGAGGAEARGGDGAH
jgi:hypothetical protein